MSSGLSKCNWISIPREVKSVTVQENSRLSSSELSPGKMEIRMSCSPRLAKSSYTETVSEKERMINPSVETS